MKFPYGLSDFKQVITNGYYYCDRTDKQICGYGATLEKKYGNLRLKKFIVVSLGFERVCFKVIKKQEVSG